MAELLTHPYSILLARLALGTVFLRSGLGKALDRERTIQVVVAYDILPKAVARIYGTLLAMVEIILAFCLLVGLWTKQASSALILLLLSFTIAVSANLIRNKAMDCGCSGRRTQEKLSWRTLARIILLLSLAVGVAWMDRGDYSLEGKLFGNSPAAFSPPLRDFLPVLLTTLSLLVGMKLLLSVIAMRREHHLLKIELSNQGPSKNL